MADDFDVEAMLEAPYKKEDEKNHDNDDYKGDSKKKKKKRSRSRSREKDRNDRDRRDRTRRSRSRSRDRSKRRSSSRDRDRPRRRASPNPNIDRRRDRFFGNARDTRGSRYPRSRSKSPVRGNIDNSQAQNFPPRFGKEGFKRGGNKPGEYSSGFISKYRSKQKDMVLPELTPEERDIRTIFCMQLSGRVRERDLEEFFTSVGQVRDVRLIVDNKTRRSKGIAYVEFVDPESVSLAMGLNGQKLMGMPVLIQPSQAEKNRAANPTATIIRGATGPMKLYVGSLHFNITEEMLKGIFEPFGKIDHIQLMMDNETGRSRGYGFVTFHNAEDAKKAMEQLNGFELAGRPMKVGHVTERTDAASAASFLDSDELDRTGIDLGTTGRLQLMAKLAEGTGLQIPAAAATALNMNPLGGIATLNPGSIQQQLQQQQQQIQQQLGQAVSAPAIATPCFMLSNMFDPTQESGPYWDQEIRQDIIDECNKHGGVVHIFVDKASPQGNVYVKCATVQTAVNTVNSLHGRWFGGKMVTAAYVPLLNYHNLFPDSMATVQPLQR